MLAVWPELFTYSLFAPLLLRLTLGLNFGSVGRRAWREGEKLYGGVMLAASLFLIIGLFVQPAALLLALLSLKPALISKERGYFSLLLAGSLSLLFLGAGIFALDWPL